MRVVLAATGFEAIPRYLGAALPGASIERVHPDALESAVANATVLVPSAARITGELLEKAAGLRLVQQWGTGLDNVDIDAATRLGIPVANALTRDTGAAEAIAEWCVMMAVALARGFPAVQAQVRVGEPWGSPLGEALWGQTAGFVGFGGIGQAVARRLRHFGMRLVAVKRSVQPGLAEDMGMTWLGSMADLPRLLAEARYIFVCVPLTPETRGLLGERELALIQPGGVLINAARGAIVSQAALLDALRSGRLGGAALDVFWHEPPDADDPLLEMPNVLVTPHVSGVTTFTYQRLAAFIASNVQRVLDGQLPVNCANPSVLPR